MTVQGSDTLPMPAWKLTVKRAILWSLAAIILLTLPYWLSNGATLVVTLAFLTAAGAIALNLVSGTAGLMSLGFVAFLTAGGFTAGYLIEMHNWSALPALLAGGLVSAVLGLIVALPTLRWRGVYVILGTFGIQYVVLFLANEFGRRLERPNGFNFGLLSIGDHPIVSTASWYYVMLVLVGTCGYAVWTLTDPGSSRVGRAWITARENRIVASAVGINVARYNILAFVISSFLIGVVGGVFGYFVGILTYESLTVAISVQYLTILLLGGLGSVIGSVIGAAFFTAVPFLVQMITDSLPRGLSSTVNEHASAVQMAIFGLTLIIVISFEPRGMVQLLKRDWRNRRHPPEQLSLVGTGQAKVILSPHAPVAAFRSGFSSSREQGLAQGKQPLLHATGMVVEYSGRTIAVAGVDFAIMPGSVIGVVGLNGAGKTSLLRGLSGFIASETGRMTAGDVLWKGQPINRLDPTDRSRRGIVLVSERDKIFKSLSVMDNLTVAARGSSDRAMPIDALMDLFPSLARRANSAAGYLSGGERQMLALARALYQGPELLLVDELSLGLAPVVVKSLIEAIRALRLNRTLSMVLVEQNAAILTDVVDEVLLMANGHIVHRADANELQESGVLEEILLGARRQGERT
jgi:branched-chain amino acid transport system permease protein